MTVVLDALGLACPQPVLKTKKALKNMEPGEVLEVHTDDPHAKADIALFIEQSDHTLISQIEEAGRVVHRIQKGVPAL